MFRLPLAQAGKASDAVRSQETILDPRHTCSPSGGGLVAIMERLFAPSSSGHPSARRMSALVIGGILSAAALCLSSGCHDNDLFERGEPIAVDDFGDTLWLARAPTRIVSLTPATTELLFALGASDRIVGRTRWDLWPDSALLVADVGDGIRPNVEAVLARAPDLVLIYASLENRTSARRLREAGVQTLSLKVDLPAQFVALTRILGRALRDTVAARAIIDSVTRTLDETRALTLAVPRPKVFWIAELEPLIAIGGGSFLSELVEIGGGANIYGDIGAPSAPISLEDVIRRNPDVIFASARIVEQIRSDPRWRAIKAVMESRLVVGESYVMGRPSVRMGEAANKIARALHPELFP